jgi:glycosyltransferase involved in cell wall biosynthesis
VSRGWFPIRRVLFASFACYLDDANGASVASRAMMEALVLRGFCAEVLCGPILERNGETGLALLLAARGSPAVYYSAEPAVVAASGVQQSRPARIVASVNGVPTTILTGSTHPRAPSVGEQQDFLSLFERSLERLSPEVVITYGGGPLSRELLGRAKGRGAATVFALHNLRYNDRAAFANVDVVIVASDFAAEHYRSRLGLKCTILPNLVDFPRARAVCRRPTYVLFVNPTVEKGVGVFARIADALACSRPDIKFLVVESNGTEADVAACGLDLRCHGNVFFHEHTHDPRRFWQVARVCLLPSLVAENQPLVAIEAMLNGVPVIGSNRGGIPETLGLAGSVLPIPARLAPVAFSLPTAEELTPWLEAIVELWDSPDVYERASRQALIEAKRWAPEKLEPLYEQFFDTVGSGRALPHRSNFS